MVVCLLRKQYASVAHLHVLGTATAVAGVTHFMV